MGLKGSGCGRGGWGVLGEGRAGCGIFRQPLRIRCGRNVSSHFNH